MWHSAVCITGTVNMYIVCYQASNLTEATEAMASGALWLGLVALNLLQISKHSSTLIGLGALL